MVEARSRFVLLAAALIAAALILTTAEIVSARGSALTLTVLIASVSLSLALLLIGLHYNRMADRRTGAALDRAAAAEASARARADELARVLAASEGLVLTGEGRVDYLGVLEAITPVGATSFVVRVEGETEAVIAAAHGPLAASVVGMRRPLPSGENGPGLTAVPIASFSASGRNVGLAMPPEHIDGLDAEIEAALALRLADHDGRCLGWLHLVEPDGEHILEPGSVSLAQLMANQIAVAMENNALLARARHQLLEVRRVQQQLVQASKLSAIGELAAAVAHEVNNPLTGILGFSELLMAELPEDDARHEEAAVIRDEAVRARSIVRALLEFARPGQPQRIPANLNDLARLTLELVRFRASEAGVRIAADYGNLPSLEVDPDGLGQVLLSLFNNAIDAMPNGGMLHVTTLCEAERVGVIVADGGIGMDEKTRARIFSPFFSTRPGSGGAAGLGLSVSLQIVESHGGTIEVASAPGQGSVFSVWLPTSWPATEEVGVGAVTERAGTPGPVTSR